MSDSSDEPPNPVRASPPPERSELPAPRSADAPPAPAPPTAPGGAGALRAALPSKRATLPPLAGASTLDQPSAFPVRSSLPSRPPPGPPPASPRLTPSAAPSRPPAAPPAGTAPDFLVPRPAPLPGAPRTVDPLADWRERIARLETQVSASRTAAARADRDAVATGARVRAFRTRLDRIESALTQAIERASELARTALERADELAPLGGAVDRLAELESVAQAARAGVAALRQDVAENRRLDDARAARLDSLEDRVTRIEADPRADALRLAIDRLDERLLTIEREQSALRGQLERSPDVTALEARIAVLEARLARRAARAPASDLRSIPGIGPRIEAKLGALGIADRAALAALDGDARDRVARELRVKRARFDAWCDAPA